MARGREWILVEYENYLAQERQAAGYGIKEMAQKCGACPAAYRAVELGTYSIFFRGKIRPYVLTACEILGVELEDVFPREVCNMARLEDPYTTHQILDMVHLRYPNGEDTLAMKEAFRIAGVGLSDMERYVVSEVFRGATMTEVAAEVGKSVERIRQIYHRCIRKLRHPLRSQQLRLIYEDHA